MHSVECKEVDNTQTGILSGACTHTHIDRNSLACSRMLLFLHSAVSGVNRSLQGEHNAAACCTTSPLTVLDQKSWSESGERGEQAKAADRGVSCRKGGAWACTCTSGQTLDANEWSAPSSEGKIKALTKTTTVCFIFLSSLLPSFFS